MAKYGVTYACGHTAILDLTGKSVDRERKLAWLKTQDCRECERAATVVAARAEAAKAGLPALAGTDKQIAWAESIRATQRAALARAREEFSGAAARAVAAGIADDALVASELAKFDAALAVIDAQAEARWWIDHRDATARDLLREAM